MPEGNRMAKEFKRINCPPGEYTQISTGQANVSFRSSLVYGGRVAFGATKPQANTTDYGDVQPGDRWEMGALGASDLLWYMPANVAETLVVVRG